MDDIERGAVRSLRALIVAAERYRHVVAEESGLGVTETQALSLLMMSGDRGQHDLAEDLRLSSGASTALVDRLERQGIAERYPHPTDRRRTYVRLTEQGHRIVSLSGERLAVAMRGAVPASELAALTEALGGIAASLNEQSERISDGVAEDESLGA